MITTILVIIAGLIYVPLDYTTIQEGIDNAEAGDTVLVADGIYTGSGNKNLDLSKDIILQSENGPDYCIIDCENDGRGFYIHDDPKLVIDGFTVCNGFMAEFGGALLCESSNPTIRNCIFLQNSVRGMTGGGGIYNHYSQPLITNCVFEGNSDSEGTIYGGGAIFNYRSEPTIIQCVFNDNQVQLRGGGIFNLYSGGLILNCEFINNSSGYGFGGGIGNWGSNPSIINCLFVGNRAQTNGGGVMNYQSTSNIANCTFTQNVAETGGGIYNWNTLADVPWITNCILWDNDPESIADVEGPASRVSYSDVQHGWAGEGNIDFYPGWENSRLLSGSPCIDSGDNRVIPGILLDLDGLPRYVDDEGMIDIGIGTSPVIDMGAYEFQEFTCSGDFDGDGIVDVNDLATLLSNYGKGGMSYPDGDMNRDSLINLRDLASFLSVY
jgi:hypothetical protein